MLCQRNLLAEARPANTSQTQPRIIHTLHRPGQSISHGQPRTTMANPKKVRHLTTNDQSTATIIQQRHVPYENWRGKNQILEHLWGKTRQQPRTNTLYFLMQVVATTLDNKWTFQKPHFRWHGIKKTAPPNTTPASTRG
jgi:hypothetical protein